MKRNRPATTKLAAPPGIAIVFYTLATVLMVLALLYFAKPVLVPIALSAMLAFVLSPLAITLERWSIQGYRIGRVGSVLVATGAAFGLIALASWALVSQVQSLAADLPNHKTEIKSKIASLRVSEDSTFSRLTDMFQELFPEEGVNAEAARANLDGGMSKDDDLSEEAPSTIIVAAAEDGRIAAASDILLPVVEPMATAALIIVLVMFLMICREDVRYRMISLIGDKALTGTTRLMVDTADRVSKFLLYLLVVNASFGIWFGIGLYLLGVPYAALWGFLTLCFRFIPFLGSPASVLFPLLISIATSSGWSQPAYVLVFFAVSELITANIIEPIVFGKTTGLTPIALLIAALFWAWVWGPIGLLLSTPLTVCLVVLGQHLPNLRFLKVLLAEQPTLDARLQYFQRLLANDAKGATSVVEAYRQENGDENAFEEVLVPALQWTRRERSDGNITAEEERFIWEATRAEVAKAEDAHDGETLTENLYRVLGYPVHHESEQIVLSMLQHLQNATCHTHCFTTKQLPSRVLQQIETEQPDVVLLTVMPPGGLPQLKFMCEETRRRSQRSHIVVVYLGEIADYDELLVELRGDGASYLTTSLGQAVHQIEMLRQDALETQIETLIESPNGDDVREGVTHAG
ncbi:putative PurR-regulated permease PerM/CheY-like chemotaxis protein [Rhodopirellula rubra]|uniref:Putative PurR-regulated permease PerM/CheY-like chemotaxis protein n=1 Tax=Aporhodopirellula rubra TaxID=980271 RepID=A0A7W5E4J8_9BACT|nr:AI-2E family transporter [Aporhodopirellula rubra]MBB3209237.1 putative PurR-regulated permease PerM/CheY-like chemotaxis protein [Aporhodopirellula rubra]